MFVQRLIIQNQSVKIFGNGLYQAQVNIQNSFVIDAQSVFNPNDKIKIITYPSRYSCHIQANTNHNGIWTINYTPHKIGVLQIDIFLGDKLLNSNPFKINVFDINQINISNLNDGFVDKLVRFDIDINRAGTGQLDILVENGRIPCQIMSTNLSIFNVFFLPHKSGEYMIDVRFNGLTIPGSPFFCQIKNLPRVIVYNNLLNAHVGHPLSFDIYNQSQLLDIKIIAPSKESVLYKQTQLNENNIRIDYILNEIGLHHIDIRSNQKMDIYGVPFALQTFDTNRLIVSDIPRFVVFNQPVEFTIDAANAGEGQLEVAINNGQIPNQVKSLGNSKFQFTFIPIINETHIISIKFNGHDLADFPKECQIISSDSIKIHGPGLNQVLFGIETWFTIETLHVSSSELKINIFTPTNEQINPTTLLTSAGLRIDWTPSEVGTYIIHATLHGNPIPGSPFHVKCYNPKKVIVIPLISESVMRKPTRLVIDTTEAGEGNLDISVNYSDHNIPHQLNSIGNNRFEVQFIPQKAIIHHCNVLFNGELIPGSPFPVNVMENQRVTAIGKGLGSIPINVPTSFSVLTQNTDIGELKCVIKGPDDHLISCIITKIDINRYEVTYTPDRVGEFHIEIYYNDIQIDYSPFTSRSFDVTKIKIQDFPLSTFVDTPSSFIIDATDSGSGSLQISISRDGKNIPNYVQNEGGVRYRINFTPDQPYPHHVQIKFNGIIINGSPFICNVCSSEFLLENYEYASINKATSFMIKPKLNSIFNRNIQVYITSPSGEKIKGKIEEVSIDCYKIDFLPNEIGDYEIKFSNNEENKFICHVYDTSKIIVSDLPIAIINQLCRFKINTTDAGSGVLSVKIKQNGNKILHEQIRISDHIYEISFTPEKADDCTVQMSFNGEINFRTFSIPIQTNCEEVQVSSIPSGVVGQPIVFTIDVAELNLLSIVVTESHSGRVISHTMTLISNDKNRYEISFIPNTPRQHIISITYNKKLLSTHHVDVCNVNKIRVSSIKDGIVGIPSIISVDTHGAGEGHLEVTISDGQRTIPAELKSIQARKFDIAFLPEISGIHSIVIAFNGIPIEGSPFMIKIYDPSISEESSLEEEEEDDHEFLIGGQLEGTKVGEIAWALCETSLTDIYQDFNFFVTDPNEVVIKHTRIQDSSGRWRIEFEPTKSGIYQIQTNIDDIQTSLASIDILPLNYERNIYGERIVHPNIFNLISIKTINENLKAQLRSSNGDEIPVEIERDSLQSKIYFTLTQIDYYQLSIIDDNDELIFDIHCVAEETDLFRNSGIEDITRLIIEQSTINAEDVNVIVKDPLAHTIPAAFYRNSNEDLVIEYIPVKPDIHEVFIRVQNNLLDICPIRIMSFQAKNKFDPVLRVQVKEILEHTFPGVIDQHNQLEINVTDPFERPIPFQRSKNELGELKISLSPVRVGTHWMRISNDDNDSFALLPIFSYDDDYVPLSPVNTPSPEQTTLQNQTSSITDSFPSLKALTTISETSEFPSSRTSSSISSTYIPSPNKEIPTDTSQIESNKSPKSSILNSESTANVNELDVTDLIDPVLRITSKFSFKDPDNKFNITINDVNGDDINYTSEHLPDGRTCISYEPTIVGRVEIHILKGNESIDGSPLVVHAFDPSAVRLINFPKRIRIKTLNSFLIDPTQAGKGSLKITIKDPNNLYLPIRIEKELNGQIAVQFEPITSGVHIVSILFNRIRIPETPFEVFVENIEEPTVKIARLPETEQRGRSIYSKHELILFAQQQERLNSLSPQIIHSRPSKPNEIISPQKEPIATEEHIPKLEKRRPSIPLSESEIRQFQILKDKFDRKQPIDIVYDPQRYPFKILLQNPYPLINFDVYLLIDSPQVAYVQIITNGIKIPLQAARRNDDTFLLKFRPMIAGDYLIILKDSTGQTIPGCSYNFPVYNPNGIHLEPFNNLQPINDCHFICNIDNIGQGKFLLIIYEQLKPIKIPYQIEFLSKNRIRISLLPSKIGTYRIYIAYRNIPINGIPIELNVYDIEGISLIAEHNEPVFVRTTVAYKVNLSEAGKGELKAELIPPENSTIPCRCYLHELNKQEYLIEYIPSESGRYQLRILFNNQILKGKTIDTDVYSLLPPPLTSSSIVQIHKISPNHIPKIGDEICLQIITDKSISSGQVSCNGISVPSRIEQTKDKHTWHLKFRSYVIGMYKIYLLHNGLPIMNSPHLLQVKDVNRLSGVTNKPCVIQIRIKSIYKSQIRAVVLLGNIQIPSLMTIVNKNLIRVNFTPEEPGSYLINIFNGDQPIEGSPFSVFIERPQIVQISGKCFHYLRLNNLGIFRIHCHGQRGSIKAKIYNLSVGDRCDIGQIISFELFEPYEELLQFPEQIFLTSLTILLTARLRLTQERIRNLTLEEDKGHTIVSFQLFEFPAQLPTNEQIINVLKNLIDKQILNLIDLNRRLLHVICGSLIVGPKGEAVNVKLFPQANGDYMGEFTPKKIGQHRIDITFGNIPIPGSPFFTEVYDPSQVHIDSLSQEFLVGIENTFEINLNNAGNVPLEVLITSPSGVNVPFKIDDLSTIKKVYFTPTEIGIHYLNAKFGSDIVPGTPMKMMVANNHIVTAYGDGIHHALQDKIAIFMIDTKDMHGDLKVRIDGPNSTIKTTLDRINNSLYKVSYIPLEIGFINISIKWNGKDIIHSPFKAIVTNPERIRIIGGWQSILDSKNHMHVMINEERKIRFDTSHAGPGTLKADIRDADNTRIPLRIDQHDSLSILSFTAIRKGKYDLIITYAGNSLPNMPIEIIASSGSTEPVIVEVQGCGLYEARVDKKSEFTIDTSRAPNNETDKPMVKLTDGQTNIEVRIRQNEKNKHIFLCSYKPTIPGTYLLSIIWKEQEIRGSPFKVNILPNPKPNPNHSASQVICSGDGLTMGILGKEMKCLIDTRSASPGELTAYCQGVNKIAFCRLIDHHDGTFTLFIKPEESGRHILTIKYNDQDVPGSPYTVKVNTPSDGRKVRVSGPGVEHGVLSTFQSQFICETKGAGAGQLRVKIRGPKGSFHLEMQRDNLQDRAIICRYNPTEPGDYLISVKWSGKHIYGSPFYIRIAESQEELEEFKQQISTYRVIEQ